MHPGKCLLLQQELAAYKLKGEYRVAERDLNDFLEARRTPRSQRPKPNRGEGNDA